MKTDLFIYPDISSMSSAAALNIKDLSDIEISEKGVFNIVLSGGNTPRSLYRVLAKEYKNKIKWDSVNFFWGDERYVPHDHPESNFKMAYETLISKIDVPESNIHFIPTGSEDPSLDALGYEELLKDFYNAHETEDPTTFDLVLLGLGEDGHTASLFPGDPVLDEKKKWVAYVTAPSNYKVRHRITLTILAINKAKNVFFLVSGESKKDAVKTVLKDEAENSLPASRIRPKKRIAWFIDKEAAARL